MVHDLVVVHALRVAGDFSPVNGDVVSAGKLRLNAEPAERVYDRAAEPLEIKRRAVAAGDDICEIDVSEVMEHRSASGKTTDYLYPVFIDKGLVYLGICVLVSADYDRLFVSPEHEHLVILCIEKILL